jgi:hypothetical protein
MTKETRKKEKAVKKIDKAVRKTVIKGVSQTVVENTVKAAMVKGAKKAPVKKATGKQILNPDAEPAPSTPAKEALKKLPGKRKPPALAPKVGNTSSSVI